MTREDLQKRLEGLKAKAALPVMSPEEEEIALLRADIAKQEAKIRENESRARAAREDDIFERLEAKHAETELHRIDTEPGMFVARLPTVAKARVFQQVALKGKLSPDAIEDFVKPCLVWCPGSNEETLEADGDALEGHLEKYTLLAAQLCQFIQDLGSAAAQVRGKR